MGHGGRRAGAGRKPGAITQKTREAAERLIADGLTPLDYMLGVLRGTMPYDQHRFTAAEKAAPFMHPRLASVQHAGPGGGAIPIANADLTNASPEQLDALEAFFGRLAGAAGGAAEDGEGGEGPAGG